MAAILAVVLSLGLAGCSKESTDNSNRKVMVLYSAGFNNLYNNLKNDILALKDGYVPEKGGGKPVLLAVSKPVNKTYGAPSSPVLIQIYKKSGKVVMDTVKTYPENQMLADASTLRAVLSDIKTMYPAKGYGMVFSSHASGWLPENYFSNPDAYEGTDTWSYAAPRSIGAEYYYEGNIQKTAEIEIEDFAAAIPYKLDYIVLDACLAGCVEVAYALRDKADWLVASPAEILADGLDYDNIAKRLLKENSPRMVCEDFITYYQNSTGRKSATVALTDLSKMDNLASVCKDLISDFRSEITALETNSVQGFCTESRRWFFDLEDIFAQLGLNTYALQDALAQAVIYKDHTEKYYSNGAMHDIRAFCGLTMFLPQSGGAKLNEFYKTLSWNQATGLVE